MHKLVLATLAAGLVAGVASAQPVTRTRTTDGPNLSGSSTVSVDRAAGTAQRQGELVRKSDGAVASREVNRQRTETGMTASGTATNFQGQTRSWDYQRDRTADGYVASGSATGFNGQSYGYAAQGTRADGGFSRSQTVTDGSGAVVADRNVRVNRADGQVSRQTSGSRPQGFRRRR